MPEFNISLRNLDRHLKQRSFIRSKAKRKIIRAGRRGGKTVGVAILAVEKFLEGFRVLYAAPTTEQIETFWREVCQSLAEPIKAKIFYKNETEHIIELAGTKQKLKAKTAWNADTLRGDYADILILDEWQMMNEDAWGLIGAPMLLDNNGDAIFVYTPPSLHSRAASKATDPLHASKLYKKALEEMGAAEREGRPSRWEAFHFSSQENPYISREALNEIAGDMTAQAYRQEILAEDAESDPNALWKAEMIDPFRLTKHPDLARIVVGVDPPGGVTECGIVVAGIGWCPCKGQAEMHGFVLADRSMQGSPEAWASMVVRSYREFSADVVVAEKNYGGDMVKSTILAANGHGDVRYKEVQATRGKAVRAEPVCAKYEQGRIHHVGNFPALEAEQLSWVPGLPGQRSPNRIDGAIWAFHELLVGKKFDSGEDQKNKDLTRELLGVGSWRNPYRGDWMAG